MILRLKVYAVCVLLFTLLYASAKNNLIMISGPAPEVGKSFISTNLATILAQSDKRVLIVDADMRRGYLNKYFNQDNQPGLAELFKWAK